MTTSQIIIEKKNNCFIKDSTIIYTLLPIQHEVITCTNADLLLVGPLGTNFSEIWIENTKVFFHENAVENAIDI